MRRTKRTPPYSKLKDQLLHIHTITHDKHAFLSPQQEVRRYEEKNFRNLNSHLDGSTIQRLVGRLRRIMFFFSLRIILLAARKIKIDCIFITRWDKGVVLVQLRYDR